MLEDIQKVQSEIEGKYFANQAAVEKTAMELYAKDKNAAINYLTDYSVSNSEATVKRWRKLWEFLVMKFNDGYINDVTKDHGRHPKSSFYGQDFLKQVVSERPEYYKDQWVKPSKKKKK